MKVLFRSGLSAVVRRRIFPLIVLLCAVGGMLLFPAPAGAAHTAAVLASHPWAPITTSDQPDFGPNVKIFDPSMSTSQIQAIVDAIANQQVDNEMGTQRYALLFKPGVYGTPAAPLDFQVGYYTEVAGLGASPTDVTINGHVDVYNRCLPTTDGSSNCIALDNFWRSLSNLTINVKGLSGCRASADFWAVSQAAPMRRVNITGGNLTLMDYCTAGPQYASGGFIADTQTGPVTVTNGSQQQFFVRDSTIAGWSNGVWNQVFSGVQGAPVQSFPNPPYTTLPTSPVTREKPYLYIDGSGNDNVFVPALRQNSSGITWANGPTPGSSIPLSQFYIARPGDSAATINAALGQGLNLIFTPGIYHVDQTVNVTKANTVVLGLGFPTIIPDGGVVPMQIADVDGVKLAGLLFDAGQTTSPVLLQVGPTGASASHAANPTSIQDVFFRIGGAGPGSATTSLVVNTNDTIIDHIWAWRADHGAGVGWTSNTADTGLIVNGANVTAYGLFVEHFQKYEVLWNGNNGRTIFFQNEMPYDPPNQAAWSHDGVNGYAAYKVADSVTSHEAWGLGSYCYFNVDPTIVADHAFEVPDIPGVQLHDLVTISLGGVGAIKHIVNNTGAAADKASNQADLVSYGSPAGSGSATATVTGTASATATGTAAASTTATPTVTPANTSTSTPPNTATNMPTSTPPNTATNTPTSTPTNTAATTTPVPATATNTTAPPTSTATSVLATATFVPATATPRPTPASRPCLVRTLFLYGSRFDFDGPTSDRLPNISVRNLRNVSGHFPRATSPAPLFVDDGRTVFYSDTRYRSLACGGTTLVDVTGTVFIGYTVQQHGRLVDLIGRTFRLRVRSARNGYSASLEIYGAGINPRTYNGLHGTVSVQR